MLQEDAKLAEFESKNEALRDQIEDKRAEKIEFIEKIE